MNDTPKDLSFDEALMKLKEIVTKLESSDIGLEQGMKLMEEAVKLNKICKDILDKAQLKITELFSDQES